MELVLAFTGNREVNEDEASALLTDLIIEIDPSEVLVLISNDEDNDVLGVVDSWIDGAGIEFIGVADEDIIRTLLTYAPVSDLALIVLGLNGQEQIIEEALDAGVDVSDLTKALYTVQRDDLSDSIYEMPLDGAESDGETTIEIPGVPVRPEKSEAYDRSESRTWTKKEIEEVVAGYVKSNEISGRTVMPAGVGVTDMPVKNLDGEILCYRNTRSGMTRVAGRGKKKPNDEEVYLTQEQIDAL